MPDGFEHVGAGNVLHIRIKVVQGFDAGCCRSEEVGLGFDQGLMQPLGDVEIVQFLVPVEASFLDMAAHGIVDAFMLQPHHEARHWILFRQAD